MSYTYYTGTEKGTTYQKYRARLGIDTSDGTSSTGVIKWVGQAQSTQIAGYGIKVAVSTSGDTSGYSGSKSGSDTGIVSDTTSFVTDASTSGTLKIPRGHSTKTVTIKAEVSGVTVSGHSKVPYGDSTVSHSINISPLDSYTVKYNANGGSGAPSSQTKWYGETLTISSSKPTRTGYTFKGWGLSSSTSTVTYKPGGSYTKNSGDTLYAVWEENTYTIKYSANGGTNSGSTSQTKTYGKALTLFQGSYFSKSGYTLIGWGTSSSDTSPNWSLGGTYTSNADATIYAIWRKQLTLSYNANGGSGAPSSSSVYIYNSVSSHQFGISSTKPTRAGYTFLGWSTSKTATSASYSASGSITISNSTTLYAVWKASTTTGTFYTYNQNGVYTANSRTVTVGGAQTVTYPDIAGKYSLIGWYPAKVPTKQVYPYSQRTAPTSDGVIAVSNVTIPTVSSNKIFYAVYRDISPSSVYVLQSGCSRVSSDADFNSYKNDIINGEQPQEVYEDTNTLFGYFELSSSATALSSTTLKVLNGSTAVSGTFTTSISGTRLFFKFVAQGTLSISIAYTITLEALDVSGKPVNGSISIKKKTQLLDITGSTIYVKSYLIRESDSGSVSVTARRTDSGMSSVGLLVGTNGINHGLYSNTMNKWLVYSDQTNLNIGNNTTSTYPLGINCTNLKLTTDGNLTLSGKVQNFFKIVEVKCALDAISAHSSQAPKNYTISPGTGYTAVGVVGWSSDRYNVIPYCPRVTGATTLRAGFVNTGNGASSSGNMDIFVLCIKGSLNGSYPS